MSDYCIPLDIQKEIIKKVSDVKSLIRFRSVSKPWKSFIDTSEFIIGYGARDTQPHSCSILSYKENTSDDEAKYICFVDDDDVDNNETLFKVVQSVIVSQQMEQYSYKKVVGACHGLLCLYGFHKSYEKWMFVIWNPSIRKSFGIVDTNDIFYPNPLCGFGVCPVTRDPTVVKLTDDFYSYDDTWSVEVFTLSSGVWNVIPCSTSLRKSISFNFLTHVVIDRFIYWGACEFTYYDDGTSTPNHMLVSFDLITKEFRVLDLPGSLTNELHGHSFVSVCKLRESLVVYGGIMVEEALCCGVWVMEHDSSFRKLFSIGTDVDKILGFRKSGEPIFEARKDYRELTTTLDVYDPSSQQIKNLGIVGAKDSFFMGSYEESLLLLDHPDSLIYPDCRRSTRRGGGCSGAGCSGGSRESGGSSRSVGQQAADSQSLSGVLAHVQVNYRDRVDANRLFYFTRLLDANPSVIPLFMDLATHEERLQFFEDLDLDPYIPRTHN